MGRTLPTATQIIIDEQSAFARFRRALRREDQRHFDRLFAGARRHTAAISQASHALPFETVMLAMLIDQAREIDELKRLLDKREPAKA